MKVLISFLSFGIDVFAGMERSIHNFANGLIDVGSQVIIYTGKMNYSNKLHSQKYKVYVDDMLYHEACCLNNIDQEILSSYEANNEDMLRNLKDIIHNEKPDYILVEDHLWGIIPYLNVKRICDCKVGILFHMLHNEHLILQCLDYSFDDFFCVSQYVKLALDDIMYKEWGKKKHNIKILPNSIEKDFFVQNREMKHITKVFCNARISKEKGIDVLLEAWNLIMQSERKIELYLTAGFFHFLPQDTIFKRIEALNFKYNNIKLLSNIHWSDIPRLYSTMDLVVLPSRSESFGMAALEALASGCMLITSSAGNLKYLMEGITQTYNPEDSYTLAQLIQNALDGTFYYNYNLANSRALLYLNTQVASNWREMVL